MDGSELEHSTRDSADEGEAVTLIGLLAVSPGARAKGPEPLARTIATLVQQAGLGDGLGIHVVRLHDAATHAGDKYRP